MQLHSRRKNGSTDDTIRCSLTRRPLEGKRKWWRKGERRIEAFEALSYTWGDATDPKTIQLDGRPFQITNNLYIALTYLRKDNEDRCIWIDAICIDQLDIQERSSQVAQMQQIYRLARTVVVFLGDTWPGLDIALDFILAGARDDTLHYNPSLEPHVMSHGMNANSIELQSYILKLFSSSWWSRLWTVQEYCLATTVMFQCGTRTINSILLEDFRRNHRSHDTGCCRFGSGFEKIIVLNRKELGERSVLDGFYQLGVLQKHRRRGSGALFVQIMTDFRLHDCSDPRDKIYGLLGLIDLELGSRIRPDYAASPKDIYLDVALTHIRFTNSLDILSCKCGWQTMDLDLPSYIPDWTTQVDERWKLHLLKRIRDLHPCYNANKGSAISVHTTSPYEISTLGVFIDRIASFARLKSWETMLSTRWELAIACEHGCPYDDVVMAFWHTMCGGFLPVALEHSGLRPVEDKDLLCYQSWKKLMESGYMQEFFNRESRMFDSTHNIVKAMRTFAITDKGYIGWVPGQARVGDSVVLFSGGRVPYVLRQTKPDITTTSGTPENTEQRVQSQTWNFIGDAYIHGIMQGERWDEEKLEAFHLV